MSKSKIRACGLSTETTEVGGLIEIHAKLLKMSLNERVRN